MLDRDRISSYIQEQLEAGESYASISVARKAIAQETGQIIEPGTLEAKIVDEAIELALVKISRNIVQADNPIATFDNLLDLYARQPTLGVRSSTSAKQQAYSTVLPLAYLASELAGISKNSRVFEPTAGNGALLIAADPGNCTVNELNPDRAQQLRSQGFTVTEHDATEFLPEEKHDVVIMNPPFGRVKGKRFRIPGNPRGTSQIDQAIAFQGLQAMKDDGRAVLILGGKNETDPEQRSDAYNTLETRGFFYALHQQYNVTDHFTIDGDLYRKQGAGWPIDVIVIKGRGKSDRPLPAVDPPRIYESFDELRGHLNDHIRQNAEPERLQRNEQSLDSRGRTGNIVYDENPLQQGGFDLSGISRSDEAEIRVDDRDEFSNQSKQNSVGENLDINAQASQPAPRSSESHGRRGRGETDLGVGTGLGGEPAGIQFDLERATASERTDRLPRGSKELSDARFSDRDTRRRDDRNISNQSATQLIPDKETRTVSEDFNVPYVPRSSGRSPGTLIPTNMAVAAQKALDKIEQKHGDLDAFVQKRLGYSSKAEMFERLYAEQIDSLALAFDQKDEGKIFLNGDQTGNGKGRFGAANIIDAKREGYIPVFVTDKPNLYAVMLGDLADIGFAGMRPFMTNSNSKMDLPDGTKIRTGDGASQEAEMFRISQSDEMGGYDVIFTTYDQLQTVNQKEPYRRDFLRAIAPKAQFIFDEAHLAGGGQSDSWDSGPPNRAKFVRELVDLSAGAVFMSATATKHPAVMDLYARRTDATYAVASMSDLENTLRAGGIPLQQMMASQFVSAGNMLRRERSFDNISFESKEVAVDHDIANGISATMRAINRFDEEKRKSINELRKEVQKEAKSVGEDNAIGQAGVKSTNFTSLMHNSIAQGLLSQKAEATVQEAIAALKRDEKPIIAVANTMDSFISEYANEQNIKPGDEINVTFGDVLDRYLERSRDVLIKNYYGKQERVRLSDEELGPDALEAYEEAKEIIADTDFSKIPLSSIDYIKHRLSEEGYQIDEITGRSSTISYGDGGMTYSIRSAKESKPQARIDIVDRFNSRKLDALIINRSAATGISLHASEKFSDQRPRHMIIAQAERDINLVMQILGRANRFGQVVEPKFTLVMANVPAEKRAGAILANKMASLNANTTAGRESDLSLSDVPDIMNVAGEEVIDELLQNHPELEAMLSNPYKGLGEGDTALIERVTGRIPLLSLEEQENLYSIIEAETKSLIEQKEAMGQNVLRADELDLDARTTSVMEVEPAEAGVVSEFTGPVMLEVVDAKALDKPPTQLQMINMIRSNLAKPLISSMEEHNQTELEDWGLIKGIETANRLKPMTDAYTQNAISTLKKVEAIQKKVNSLNEQSEKFEETLRTFPPGESVQIQSKDDKGVTRITYGVVVDIEQKNRALGSPVAPSNWSLRILSHQGKLLNIPFSKINNDQSAGIKLDARSETLLGRNVYQEFDRLQRFQRAEMQIFTGNLLKAYQKFPQGKFVNFTDNSGNTRQGLLMDQEFDIVQKLQELPVEFKEPQQVREFIEDVTQMRGVVESVDGNLKIQADSAARMSGTPPEFYVVRVPDSKNQGGKYYLNEKLLEAGDSEFFSVGGRMEMKIDPEDLDQVVQVVMQDLETKLAVTDPSFKELLRQHLGEAIPTLNKIEQVEASVNQPAIAEQTPPPPEEKQPSQPIDLTPPAPKASTDKAEAIAQSEPITEQKLELRKVPDEVRERIEWAIATIQNYNEQIERGRSLDSRFGGDGRYEYDVHEKLIGEVQQSLATIEKFRSYAPNNHVDAEKVLQELSFQEPTDLTAPAKEWEEEKQEAEEAIAEARAQDFDDLQLTSESGIIEPEEPEAIAERDEVIEQQPVKVEQTQDIELKPEAQQTKSTELQDPEQSEESNQQLEEETPAIAEESAQSPEQSTQQEVATQLGLDLGQPTKQDLSQSFEENLQQGDLTGSLDDSIQFADESEAIAQDAIQSLQAKRDDIQDKAQQTLDKYPSLGEETQSTTETQPQSERGAIADRKAILPPEQQGSQAAKNVAQLLHDAGIQSEVLSGDDFHLRAEQPHFLPFVVERHSDQLYLTHYQTLGGNQFIDAELLFQIGDRGNLSLHETASFNPFTGGELRNKDHGFAAQFSSNLLEQNWAIALSKAREDLKQEQDPTSQVAAQDKSPVMEETRSHQEQTQSEEVRSTGVASVENGSKNISVSADTWAKVAQAIGRPQVDIDRINQIKDKPLNEQAKVVMQKDFVKHSDTLNDLRTWYRAAVEIEKPQAYLDGIKAIANDFKNGTPIAAEVKSIISQDLHEGAYKKLEAGLDLTKGERVLQEVAKRGLEMGMPPKYVHKILLQGNQGLRDTHKVQPKQTEKYVEQVTGKAIQRLPEQLRGQVMKQVSQVNNQKQKQGGISR